MINLFLSTHLVETKKVLKKTISANKALAKLNGVAKIIPNQNILVNSLVLQEAKDSSEIENIITTYDEVYRSDISDDFMSSDIKEVQNYKDALYLGFDIITSKQIQEKLEQNDAGLRKQIRGTFLSSIYQKNIYRGASKCI